MLGFGTKPAPVKEYEAEGETERVYHEIKMSMRATGVNLNFRTWAGFENFFPAMWDSMRPIAETRRFEDSADHVRAEAARLAVELGTLGVPVNDLAGESQAHQIEGTLDLYHYINPKLIVFTSAVLLALEGEHPGTSHPSDGDKIERGMPPRMHSMEMVAEESDDERLQAVFDEIMETFELSSINSDYRSLGRWPAYLEAAWNRLKPVAQTEKYKDAAERISETARRLAGELPSPASLSRERVEELGDDFDSILKKTEEFERLLAPLILNVALFSLDWNPPEELERSPFPTAEAMV